ncbi:MAG: UDP-N-acetylmuramate--L-alanine ligase [Phycisphaerae bacterium]
MIGIGGSGMSAAAQVLVELGAIVTGSDLTSFPGLGELVSRGVRVSIGHDAGFLDARTDLVVISAAIPESNPELAGARRRGLPVLKYAQLLGVLTSARRTVAIAGTHGKTTTTAMCAHLLRSAGLAPSFICGGRSTQLGGASGTGVGSHFVVESCEFDRSFLHLQPHSAAILNVESDHLDCFRDLTELIEAFGLFAANVASDGLLVCNAQSTGARRAAGQAAAPVQTFAIEAEADWQAVGLREDRGLFSFDVLFRGSAVLSTSLVVPGRHNVENALAATALAVHAGANPVNTAEALSRFSGVDRRMSWRGAGSGVNIIDDYAHHPTEIRVTIEAARSRYRPRRTWVVFQPHQYERTRHFLDAFASSLAAADEIVVPDIYGARESSGDSTHVRAEDLVSRICGSGGRARYASTLMEAADHVASNVSAGDLVLTLGAGDVWKVADELVERIR